MLASLLDRQVLGIADLALPDSSVLIVVADIERLAAALADLEQESTQAGIEKVGVSAGAGGAIDKLAIQKHFRHLRNHIRYNLSPSA